MSVTATEHGRDPFAFLGDELAQLDAQHQRRTLRELDAAGPLVRRGQRTLINFASNDYLGLAAHPHLKQAAIRAIEYHGVGAGASRLVSGHLRPHAELEARFAVFKHAQAALLLPTGYLANLALLATLPGPGDLVCLDKLCHASLIDAARLAGLRGAQVRFFPHLHYAKLERLLASSAAAPRRYLITDSIFSMDGDAADLSLLCDLAERHDAILIVDEAHGTGVLGRTGAGLAEHQGVAERVHLTVSTASKALGSLGGVITGPRVAIDALVNRARPFIYTTAVPAAQAAAIAAALDVIRDEPQRRVRVLELAQRLREAIARMPALASASASIQNPKSKIQNDKTPARHGPARSARSDLSPIVPVIVGSAEAALHLSAHLEARGILGVAIRPPTVAPGAARVRLSVRADHTDEHLEALVAALRGWPGGSRE